MRVENAHKKTLLLIIGLGIILRIIAGWIIGYSKIIFFDEQVYLEIAQSFARTLSISFHGQPTAWAEPGYPILLAVGTLLNPTLFTARLLQVLLSGGMIGIVFALAKQLFPTKPQIALISSFLYSVYPPHIFLTHMIYPQFIATLWAMLFLVYLFRLLELERSLLSKDIVILALFTGGGALILGTTLFFSIPATLLLFYYKKCLKKDIAVFLLWIAAFISPWIVRNYIIFQKFIPLSTKIGAIWIGNNPKYKAGDGVNVVEKFNDRRIQHYYDKTGVNRSFLLFEEAIKFMYTHPLLTLRNFISKFINFWRPFPQTATKTRFSSALGKLFYAVSWIPVFVLGVYGFFKNKEEKTIIIAITSILCFAAGYSIFFTKVRHRMPVEPFFIIMASSVLWSFYEKIKGRMGYAQRIHHHY